MQAAADGGGGGGGGFFDSIGSGMDSLGQQMRDFAESAKQQQFSVNDAGGKALLGSIQDMQEFVSETFMDLNDQADRSRMYGTSHGANVVEPYMQNVKNDADGLIPMLEKFQHVLNDAEDAIKQAMENYKWADADAKQGMPEAGGDVNLSPGGARATPIPYTPPAGSGSHEIQSV